MSFEQIIGQERAKVLAEAWVTSGRLPHAILICGPAGVGKRRFALELTKAILCRTDSRQACDRCVSCRKVDSLQHPDVHTLMPLSPLRNGRDETRVLADMRQAVVDYVRQDARPFQSTANIARDHLRLLRREMSYAPVEAARRVGVIFEADCMHPAGANSLLKILEEPPGKAVFILVSAAPERMLPTVLSRCQRLVLQRLGRVDLQMHLRDSGLAPEKIELAVRLAEGSLRRAMQVAQGDLDELRVQVETFLSAGVRGEDQGYWTLLDELGARRERGRLESFLELCSAYLRDLFLLSCGKEEMIAQVDRYGFLKKLHPSFTAGQIETAALEVDRAFDYLSRNVNAQLVLADLWRSLRGDTTAPVATRGTGSSRS